MGVGHTSAADAVREALSRSHPDTQAKIVDSYKYAASVVSRVVSNGYIGMVKTIPQMYRFLYARAERATDVGPFRQWIHQFTATNIRSLLEDTRPDVVVCTHAFPCGVMAEYKRQFADAPPVVGVVTDFVVHAFWVHDNIDAYAVATPQMRTALINRKVEPERILVSGIPVRAEFSYAPADRDALRERLGLPKDRFALLLMGGGLGIGPLEMMMQALSGISAPLSATVISGRNKTMQRRILETAERVDYPVRVLSFVNNVYDYMHSCDLLLSKPGGLTSAEALACGMPMVLVKPLPGQEERNTRFLVESKAARRVKNERDLRKTVADLLAHPEHMASMRQASAAAGRPNAAADVAELIVQLVRAAKASTGRNADVAVG